jgi:hypothetical protein
VLARRPARGLVPGVPEAFRPGGRGIAFDGCGCGAPDPQGELGVVPVVNLRLGHSFLRGR